MLNFAIGVFFTLHGLVHLLWFAMSWQLTAIDGLPYSTRLLAGRMEVGDTGIRIIGLFWVVATGLWIAAGLGVMLVAPWWPTLSLVAALFSSLFCLLALPVAKYGLLINIAVLIVLFLNSQYHWLPTP